MGNNFQRIGSKNNASVGSDFEIAIKTLFEKRFHIKLEKQLSVSIGVSKETKPHRFDLGNSNAKVAVECKSHKWTSGGNVPSAKFTVWNEAMYYFSLLPKGFKCYFIVLKDLRGTTSLGEHYRNNFYHLIPPNVTILEYDEKKRTLTHLKRVKNKKMMRS